MRSFLLAFILLLGAAATAHAASPDLSLTAGNIKFSKSVLIAGDTVRVYAKVRNPGEVDVAAQVFFYQGPTLIGTSQVVSVLAGGGSDDVFIDYELPDGQFNIRAVIQGQSPVDVNPDNDVAVTPLYEAVPDTDRDGIVDAEDNCPEKANVDQGNQDNDGTGDVCDIDKDGDGTLNSEDFNPTDPSIANAPAPRSVAQAEPEPAAPTPTVAEAHPAPSPFLPLKSPTPSAQSQPTTTSNGNSQQPEPVSPSGPGTDQLAVAITDPSAAPLVAGAESEGGVRQARTLLAYKQKDWRTYEFGAVPALNQPGATFAWDFGDGATSVQKDVTHAFPKSGVYTVTLATIDNQGNITSEARIFDVSFFHLQNPYVLVTIAFLILIIVGLLFFIVRLRRGNL